MHSGPEGPRLKAPNHTAAILTDWDWFIEFVFVMSAYLRYHTLLLHYFEETETGAADIIFKKYAK